MNTHASALEHAISPQNAGLLQQKWVFTTAGDVSATPTVDGGSVYVPDWGGLIHRIDAQKGTAIWSRKVSDYTGDSTSVSRTSPAIGLTQIVFGDQAGATVMAVDKTSGNLLWKTTLDTAAKSFITNSPVIFGNRVYVGVSSDQEVGALSSGFKLDFRGSIAALDLQTGQIVWQTRTVPLGYTGGAVWASNFIVDVARNSLVADTGNNYSVPASASACLKSAGANVPAQLACLDPTDYVDSVIALNLQTGAVKWSKRLQGSDTYTLSCVFSTGGVPCPDPHGPDYDFGSGPNMIQTTVNGKLVEAIGAGQKSGVYWALDPNTGAVLWGTQVGPGGAFGGLEFGAAVDSQRVYVAEANFGRLPYKLQPQNTQSWSAGSWAALNAGTGAVEWQVPASGLDTVQTTLPALALGQVSVANGVFYAGSMSGDMVALDAATGKQLWKFTAAGSVVCGPSIVDGTVYWGTGYAVDAAVGIGTGNNKLYAFSVPHS